MSADWGVDLDAEWEIAQQERANPRPTEPVPTGEAAVVAARAYAASLRGSRVAGLLDGVLAELAQAQALADSWRVIAQANRIGAAAVAAERERRTIAEAPGGPA